MQNKPKQEGPVIREVVERVTIKPGVYGKVSVHELTCLEDGYVYLALIPGDYAKPNTVHVLVNDDVLTAAISTLTDIRDAMRGVVK